MYKQNVVKKKYLVTYEERHEEYTTVLVEAESEETAVLKFPADYKIMHVELLEGE